MELIITKKPRTNPWLICPKPNPQAKVRLFCFPYAGGGATIYHKWHMGLPSSVEVCAVQPPGRGNRLMDKPFTNLMTMVHAVAEGINAALDKPFVFFGHSMGAMMAFELSRLLRQKQRIQPLHLFVSGRMAPHIPSEDEPTFHLPDQEFLEKLRELNGTPRELLENAELMQVMLPLLRADFEVCQTYDYVPGPPLTCPVTIYGGLQDEKISEEKFEAWKEHTADKFVRRMFPGDHFFIHSDQALLLDVLSQELDRIVAQHAHLASAMTATGRFFNSGSTVGVNT
jgi:medium-chain acyl-[acyl-carrier-protein] hydrolase